MTGGKRHTAAVAIGRPLTWDSRYFGVPMGRLDYLIQAPDATRSDVRAALSLALDQFRALRIRHVAVKLDVEDGEDPVDQALSLWAILEAEAPAVEAPAEPAPEAMPLPIGSPMTVLPAPTQLQSYGGSYYGKTSMRDVFVGTLAAALAAIDPVMLQAGSSEIRNWMVVAEMARELDVEWVEYIPGYRSEALTGTGFGFAAWRTLD